MVTDPSGEPEEHVGLAAAPSVPWLLRRVRQRYQAAVAAAFDDAGLGSAPGSGFWVLVALEAGTREASELVKVLGVSKQAISKLVGTLVTDGFVAREANTADRRRTDLALTAKGRRAVDELRSAAQATERAFVESVGEEAWSTTVHTLGILAREHEAEGDRT